MFRWESQSQHFKHTISLSKLTLLDNLLPLFQIRVASGWNAAWHSGWRLCFLKCACSTVLNKYIHTFRHTFIQTEHSPAEASALCNNLCTSVKKKTSSLYLKYDKCKLISAAFHYCVLSIMPSVQQRQNSAQRKLHDKYFLHFVFLIMNNIWV